MSKELNKRFIDLASDIIRKAENIRMEGETLVAEPEGQYSRELFYSIVDLKNDVVDLQRVYLEAFYISRG